MNISGKSFQYPRAGVAALIATIIASVWAGIIGVGINEAMARPQMTETTTAYNAQPSGELSPVTDLPTMSCEYFDPQDIDSYGTVETCTDPCSYSYARQNNIPFYYIEECLDQYEDGMIGESTTDAVPDSQILLPVHDPLAISLLQSDGQAVHCRPWGSSAGVVSTNETLVVDGGLVNIQMDPGNLTVSPLHSDIEPGRVAVVVNSTFAAWLPATAAYDRLVLRGEDWKSDVTMEWHAELCVVR
jgi:hypothetical protein